MTVPHITDRDRERAMEFMALVDDWACGDQPSVDVVAQRIATVREELLAQFEALAVATKNLDDATTLPMRIMRLSAKLRG